MYDIPHYCQNILQHNHQFFFPIINVKNNYIQNTKHNKTKKKTQQNKGEKYDKTVKHPMQKKGKNKNITKKVNKNDSTHKMLISI